ncbi:MAG: zinc-dependent alcohol dehydrogenase family protein [Salinibacter sp.]|uniref:zinc-dependent alcohol dehydrogenase family protein n=1 Tax=Salinibacter sp. TaxID=2065818 RepID=UPI0035D498AC
MQAVVYDDFGADPEIREVPAPEPSPRGVVVEVRASGLCRSDWHGWKGHDPVIEPPHVPGHELAGVVSEVGSEVERWSPGDRVTVPFVGGCGQCEQCATGHQQVCPNQFQPGFTGWGSFAERVAIDYADTNMVHLPDELDMVTAASLGCRFGTAFRAVVDQGEVAPGEWVAVHGCGGVGLSATMIASALGARVVGVDVSAEALTLAEEVGAAALVDAHREEDVVEAVRGLTDGGAHVSIDALGSQDTCFQSVSCLRKRGRHVQVGLLAGEDRHAAVPLDRVVADELELRGTHGVQAHRYPALLGMVRTGSLHPGKLVQRVLPLREAGTALKQLGTSSGPGIQVIDSFG